MSRDRAYKILGIVAISLLKASRKDGAYRRMYPKKTPRPFAVFSASMIFLAEDSDNVMGFSSMTCLPA